MPSGDGTLSSRFGFETFTFTPGSLSNLFCRIEIHPCDGEADNDIRPD